MIKNKRNITLLAVILLSLVSSFVYPCTTFVLRQENKIVFGRNLDWISGSGLIMTNARNVKKTALVAPSEKAIEWISKFGSITFNQIGRDLPYGGINETGLVVEHMTLEETQYPSKDNRHVIGANQWIQFQLDNFSKVEEVINSDTLLRIVDATSKYHFLISDRFGNVATIEFINGKMITHKGASLSVPALANSTYDTSLQCYKTKSNTDSNLSLYNYCTAANQVQQYKSPSSDSMVKDAFQILNSVSQGLSTKWSIVYDITEMKIYFKIFETPTIVGEQKIFKKQPGEAKVKIIDLKNFDFDCSKAVKVLNLEQNCSGIVDEKFTNYSVEINKEYIFKAFSFFKDWGIDIVLDNAQIDFLAKYPNSFSCIEQ